MTAVQRAHRQGFQAMIAAAGQSVTYLPAGGLEADEVVIRGVFLEKYQRIDPVTLQVIDTVPAFEAVAEDVPEASEGDRLLIGSTYYNTLEAKRDYDGVGQTLFILSRDTHVPLAPSRLNAQLNLGNIVLAWTRNATNNSAVEIWADADGGGAYVRLATLGAGITSYTDDSGTVSTRYRVRNTNNSGPSPFTHAFDTNLWGLVDESGTLIEDEGDQGIQGQVP